MKKLSIVCVLAVCLSSCSFSSSPKEEVANKPSDELEFVVDSAKDAVPEFTNEITSEIKVEEKKVIENKLPDEIEVIKEPKFNDYKKEIVPKEKEERVIATETPSVKVESEVPLVAGRKEQYQLQDGETLMMAAFKIYGDYRKWHNLKELNKFKKIGKGSVIDYYVPEQAFGWQPSGLPYLVKTGDTLGLISQEKYGTVKKWKSIYENNRPLIHSPNLIFAGFTLYYVPSRDIASKHN